MQPWTIPGGRHRRPSPVRPRHMLRPRILSSEQFDKAAKESSERCLHALSCSSSRFLIRLRNAT
eukprot:scaffold211989_cov46-Prasinocladus_malaysianus.AAC.1